MRQLVVMESPFAASTPTDRERNLRYGRIALTDCLTRGEAPVASHLLYTQPGVLNDDVPGERRLGIDAGHAWYEVADACVVYADFGISSGMWSGIEVARRRGLPVKIRLLGESA